MNVSRLSAPSAYATTGVTFAGQTFDGSVDGNVVGEKKEEWVKIDGEVGRMELVVVPLTAVMLHSTRG